MLAVDAEFKMQMRPGGPTGRAHGAQCLALRYRLAAPHVDAAQVRIDRGVAIVMTHRDHLAVALAIASGFDHALAHAAHRRASGRCVVDAQVRAPGLQDRVKAHLEATRHARERQW